MILRVLALSILAAGSFIGVLYADELANSVEGLLSRVEIHLFSQVRAAEDGEKNTDAKGQSQEEKAPPPMAETAGSDAGDVRKKDNYIHDLVARKKHLDEREVELKKVEEELQGQKKELARKMKELEMIRQNISTILQGRVAQDNERIDKLVQFYSNMKAANAAKVFERLDEDLATEIIGRMKKQNAGEIFNKLTPEKAQKLSEKFAGYISR